MSQPERRSLADLAEEFRRQRELLAHTQRALREISCTASSKRRLVTVTVGYGGAVRDVTFAAGGGYKRMAPAELAEVVLSTVKDAQDQVSERTAEVLAPTMPPEVDLRRVLRGEVDLADLLPAMPTAEAAAVDVLGPSGTS